MRALAVTPNGRLDKDSSGTLLALAAQPASLRRNWDNPAALYRWGTLVWVAS